jgi:hypothetical protein
LLPSRLLAGPGLSACPVCRRPVRSAAPAPAPPPPTAINELPLPPQPLRFDGRIVAGAFVAVVAIVFFASSKPDTWTLSDMKAERIQREMEDERRQRAIELDATMKAIELDATKHPELYGRPRP